MPTFQKQHTTSKKSRAPIGTKRICADCGQECGSSAKLYHHRRKQHLNPTVRCCACGIKFHTCAQRNAHAYAVHVCDIKDVMMPSASQPPRPQPSSAAQVAEPIAVNKNDSTISDTESTSSSWSDTDPESTGSSSTEYGQDAPQHKQMHKYHNKAARNTAREEGEAAKLRERDVVEEQEDDAARFVQDNDEARDEDEERDDEERDDEERDEVRNVSNRNAETSYQDNAKQHEDAKSEEDEEERKEVESREPSFAERARNEQLFQERAAHARKKRVFAKRQQQHGASKKRARVAENANEEEGARNVFPHGYAGKPLVVACPVCRYRAFELHETLRSTAHLGKRYWRCNNCEHFRTTDDFDKRRKRYSFPRQAS